eukprot:29671_1
MANIPSFKSVVCKTSSAFFEAISLAFNKGVCALLYRRVLTNLKGFLIFSGLESPVILMLMVPSVSSVVLLGFRYRSIETVPV